MRAMETGVEKVRLKAMTLDIWSLIVYSGQGKCRWLCCLEFTVARYRDQLRTWAIIRNWTVTCDKEDRFVIRRM